MGLLLFSIYPFIISNGSLIVQRVPIMSPNIQLSTLGMDKIYVRGKAIMNCPHLQNFQQNNNLFPLTLNPFIKQREMNNLKL